MTTFRTVDYCSALLLWSSRQAPAQAGCTSSAWRPVSCCFFACPLGVSVGLCCFTLTHWADHASPVCQVLLCSLILAVNWVLTFFLPPQHPKHFHSFFLSVTVHQFFPLLSYPSPHSPLYHLYFSDTTFVVSTQRPNWSLLCCGGPQKRTGQMVSDDFRALLISTGNSLVLLLAWCSFRVSAGPRVEQFRPLCNISVNFRWSKWLGTCTHPSVWSRLCFFLTSL